MARTAVSRRIHAPIDAVFDTVANIECFARAVPHITEVTFLTDRRSGVGTRFAETRVMRGRQATTTLEVTEYEENERIRLVSDEGGTIWDTVFTLSAVDGSNGATDLAMVMEATPYKLSAKIVNPLMKGIIRRSIEGDLDAVKAYCESAASS
ncbi:MAG: SRPBCC family protein [Acidimicrobiia bacterium]|nr:SRPBCC family protein [Acidimicrobiia bacterium]